MAVIAEVAAAVAKCDCKTVSARGSASLTPTALVPVLPTVTPTQTLMGLCQVVLRKWEPDLSLENEFRAFVYKGKLTAISQYDHYGVFPHLQPLKPIIEASIREQWQLMHDHVGEDTYCCDWAYLPSKGEKEQSLLL